ncbi:membrane protein [Marivirga lumbricoides]|uniref:Membrane protein n=1 Tax=Marivirga lumbricoides TaxID=1046115 RepID=A0ABQ1MES6_9BACT|nr:membrane protein [Marivirga lumbricoides]
MADSQNQIDNLVRKLEILLQRQDDFSREINDLRTEINSLKASSLYESPEFGKTVAETDNAPLIADKKKETFSEFRKSLQPAKSEPFLKPESQKSYQIKSDFEKFIGENLINKIGIAITVIGVAIGAKYSIENDLVSPLTRIIFGYLIGIGLIGFGMRLKKNYENYSAVLVSGAIAILYFITYSGYNFYHLFPQKLAFLVMVIFTAFAVLAAINYNKQIIAHIGLVGAYAIPFLLSEGSGDVAVLFTYMAVINIGILVISFKKYWKELYYSSFCFTWLIYFSWFASIGKRGDYFSLSLIFLFIFFTIFYMSFLAYKVLQKQQFQKVDILLLIANSFVFYGLGYAILDKHEIGEQLLGLFTLANGIIHFLVSIILFRKKLADRNLFYLVVGLVLVFITLAIPVQLDGSWVTIMWAGEAALLFWIGRTKSVPIYENLAYPLMALAFFSIIHDWSTVHDLFHYETSAVTKNVTPIFNVNFLTAIFFVGAFSFIYFLNSRNEYTSALSERKEISRIISFSIATILFFSIYYMFRLEIAFYWDQLFIDSLLSIPAQDGDYLNRFNNYDLLKFKAIWIINYSLFFVSVLSFVNYSKLKKRQLGLINMFLTALAIVVFLVQGLYILSELRESYLNRAFIEYYKIGSFNLAIRYVSYAFIAIAFFTVYKYLSQEFKQGILKRIFDLALFISLIWIFSSELIHWMDLYNNSHSYKIALSILWGVYSLLTISYGIWKKKKHLRMGAIVMFGLTLIKLFFYDISHLNTIAKTVVFVVLGILLLIISFLYNKYKHIISDEVEN